jgi:hypothetical protein
MFSERHPARTDTRIPRLRRAGRATRRPIYRGFAPLLIALTLPSAMGTPATAAPSSSAVPHVSLTLPLDQPTVSSNSWRWHRRFSNPPQYSPPVVVTASGGVAPYTYSWQPVSNPGSLITATTPTISTTSFSSPIPAGQTVYRTAVFHCIVTDAAGNVAYTPNVTVEFEQEWGD